MARMGRELPVRAALATLQSALGTEIAAVQSERGDALALAAVESWYAFPREPMRPGNGAEVNVFMDIVDFDAAGLSNWTSGASGRRQIQWTGDLVTRIGFANRDNKKESEMIARWWRYEIALLRTYANSQNLGQAGLITILNTSTTHPPRGLVSSDSQRAMVVEVTLRLRVHESHASETVASGGVPPSATLES